MARQIKRPANSDAVEADAPLVIQIARTLTQDIIGGRFGPGERIREQELADRFGTSRGPVREAIRLVEIDGLIETEHWRGARVVDLSLDEVDDLFELVGALLGVVAKLCARHASDADLDRFSLALGHMEHLLTEGGGTDAQLGGAFEAARVLRQSCGSPRASETLAKISRLAFLEHRYLAGTDLKWRRAALLRWRKLEDALRSRKPEAAEAAARLMIDQSRRFTIEQLQRRAEAAVPRRRLATA